MIYIGYILTTFSLIAFAQIVSNIRANARGTQIGKISKQWSGLAREFFTDADYFGIKFPTDSDVYTKATLLGACMLIVKTQNGIESQEFRFFCLQLS